MNMYAILKPSMRESPCTRTWAVSFATHLEQLTWLSLGQMILQAQQSSTVQISSKNEPNTRWEVPKQYRSLNLDPSANNYH